MAAADEKPSLNMPRTSSAAGLPERAHVTSLLHFSQLGKTVVEVASAVDPRRRLFWRAAFQERYAEVPVPSPEHSMDSPVAAFGSTCLFALVRRWSPMERGPGKAPGLGSSGAEIVRVELAGATPSVSTIDLQQALGPQRSVSRLLSVGANDQHLQMVVMQRPVGAQGGIMKYVIATVGVDGASYTEEDALPGVFF